MAFDFAEAAAAFADIFKGWGRKSDAVTFAGFWPDVDPDALMQRFGGRFVGGTLCDMTGNRYGSQGSIMPDASFGPSYLLRDTTWAVGASAGGVAFTAVAKTSLSELGYAIADAAFVDNDAPGASGYARYSEVVHRAGAGGTRVHEFDVKNLSGSCIAPHSYGLGSGPFGDWAVAGGDPTNGQPVANAPSAAPYVVLSNAAKWTRAFVVDKNALEGCDGVTGTATAVELAKGHGVRWGTPPNGELGASIRSDVADTLKRITQLFYDNAFIIFGANSKRIFDAVHTLNAVNYPSLRNSVAGQPVQILAGGDDADIDVKLTPKGTGKARFGAHAASADIPVTGYIEIKDAAGNVRRLLCG